MKIAHVCGVTSVGSCVFVQRWDAVSLVGRHFQTEEVSAQSGQRGQ